MKQVRKIFGFGAIFILLTFMVANIAALGKERSVNVNGRLPQGSNAALYLPFVAGPPFVGEGILFSSNRDGNYEIYVMNGDGSQQTNLTMEFDDDIQASWSPDGTRIVFVSNRSPFITAAYQIYVMDADGNDPVALTDNSGSKEPDWSPDGQAIIFSWGDHLYRMKPDGTELVGVINSATAEGFAHWSPDGQQIVFTYHQGYNNSEIYKANIDGSNFTRLTFHGGLVGAPKWSPDGSRIAYSYSTDLSGNWEVYIMNSDGSSAVNISNHGAKDFSPVWSPDGSQLAFISDRDGDNEVYVMNVDGSGLVQLTHNDAWENVTDWR